MGNQNSTGKSKDVQRMQCERISDVPNRNEDQGNTTRTNIVEGTIIKQASYLLVFLY